MIHEKKTTIESNSDMIITNIPPLNRMNNVDFKKKNLPTEIYGGYTGNVNSYFVLVQTKYKNNPDNITYDLDEESKVIGIQDQYVKVKTKNLVCCAQNRMSEKYLRSLSSQFHSNVFHSHKQTVSASFEDSLFEQTLFSLTYHMFYSPALVFYMLCQE